MEEKRAVEEEKACISGFNEFNALKLLQSLGENGSSEALLSKLSTIIIEEVQGEKKDRGASAGSEMAEALAPLYFAYACLGGTACT